MLPTAKLRIIPYLKENAAVDTAAGALAATAGNQGFGNGFTVQINPESLNFSQSITYKQDQGAGSSNDKKDYAYTEPATLAFEVIFDRTGAVQNGDLLGNELALLSSQGVDVDINTLKKVVLEYDGTIHRPREVKIVWGKSFQLPGQMTLRCQLTNFSYAYKKFNAFGIPLRTSVSLTFQEVLSDELRQRKENNSSPDITHLVTVKAGDTLPLLAYKVYGDSRYYVPVMQANNLVHFRELEPGQKLVFPPIA